MNKNKIVLLASFLLVLSIQQIYAQQYPLRYMYDQYKYTVNPAAIKIGEGIGLNTNYSNNQFDQISDNSLFGFGIEGGFLYENMGLGLIFSQENAGILQNTDVKLEYAYRVRLAKKHWLTLGLSAGVVYQGQNADKIITGDYTDPLIGESETGFSAGFGINYRWESLEVDLSIPAFNSINKEHIPVFALAAYNIPIAEDWKLKPIVMYNELNPGMNLFDFRLQGSFKDFVWLQAGYRTSEELLFAAGGSYQNFNLGFAYGFNLSNYNDLNKGNLEVILGYRFGNAKLKKEISQKEVNKQTQESLVQINSNLSALKENDVKQTQELQRINQSVQNLNNELNNEFKGRLTEIKESVLSIQKEELEINEPKILDRGYFVVVYSTKTYDDAEAIVQRMSKQDVKGYIIKDSKRTFFYIYTAAYDDLNPALSQSEKERQRGFTGAWVLVVK